MRLINALICCLLLIPASTVLADTIHVPADQPSIQVGFDTSGDGDTVFVADGTYIGSGKSNVAISGRSDTFQSANGSDDTIIHVDELGRGMTIGPFRSK